MEEDASVLIVGGMLVLKKYHCPVEITVEVLGGKWKTRILWELYHKNCHFSDLRRAIPDITKKMLTQCLRELEQNNLVIRMEKDGKVIRVEYALSEYGVKTIPLVTYMSEWGSNHFTHIIESSKNI